MINGSITGMKMLISNSSFFVNVLKCDCWSSLQCVAFILRTISLFGDWFSSTTFAQLDSNTSLYELEFEKNRLWLRNRTWFFYCLTRGTKANFASGHHEELTRHWCTRYKRSAFAHSWFGCCDWWPWSLRTSTQKGEQSWCRFRIFCEKYTPNLVRDLIHWFLLSARSSVGWGHSQSRKSWAS